MKAVPVIAGAVAAGFALGYFIAAPSEEAAPEPVRRTSPAKGKLADRGDDASLRALRARVAELERQLAARGAEDDQKTEQPVEEAEKPAEPPRTGPERFQAEMARLQKEDPARYAQITNRMAQWRQRRIERAQAKLDYLSAIDVSRMSPKAQQIHADLQEMIARREEIENDLHREGLTQEERHQVFEELRAADRDLEKLNRAERNNLIVQAAREAGVKGKNLQGVLGAMNDIVEMTESGHGWHGGHGGHRGGPHGGGGRR